MKETVRTRVSQVENVLDSGQSKSIFLCISLSCCFKEERFIYRYYHNVSCWLYGVWRRNWNVSLTLYSGEHCPTEVHVNSWMDLPDQHLKEKKVLHRCKRGRLKQKPWPPKHNWKFWELFHSFVCDNSAAMQNGNAQGSTPNRDNRVSCSLSKSDHAFILKYLIFQGLVEIAIIIQVLWVFWVHSCR